MLFNSYSLGMQAERMVLFLHAYFASPSADVDVVRRQPQMMCSAQVGLVRYYEEVQYCVPLSIKNVINR
jgi:hypothetical protein